MGIPVELAEAGYYLILKGCYDRRPLRSNYDNFLGTFYERTQFGDRCKYPCAGVSTDSYTSLLNVTEQVLDWPPTKANRPHIRQMTV